MRSALGSVVRFLRGNWMWLLALVAIAAAAQFATNADEGAVSLQEFDDQIRAGQPVVVEFYSPT
jgi:hypothetical protein